MSSKPNQKPTLQETKHQTTIKREKEEKKKPMNENEGSRPRELSVVNLKNHGKKKTKGKAKIGGENRNSEEFPYNVTKILF